MKKSIRIFFAGLLTMTLAIACKKEQMAAPCEGTVIEASHEAHSNETQSNKTYLNGADQQTYWSGTDKIAAFDANRKAYVSKTITSGAGTTKGTFTFNESFTPTYGVFPCIDGTEFEQHVPEIDANGIITASLWSVQTWPEDGSFSAVANLAVAKAEGSGMGAFRNVGAILCISVANYYVNCIRLEANENLSGKVKINYNNGNPYITEFVDGKKYVEIRYSNNDTREHSLTKGGVFYFVVAPGTYTGLKITLTDNYGRKQVWKNSGSLTVARSQRVNLSTAALFIRDGSKFRDLFVASEADIEAAQQKFGNYAEYNDVYVVNCNKEIAQKVKLAVGKCTGTLVIDGCYTDGGQDFPTLGLIGTTGSGTDINCTGGFIFRNLPCKVNFNDGFKSRTEINGDLIIENCPQSCYSINWGAGTCFSNITSIKGDLTLRNSSGYQVIFGTNQVNVGGNVLICEHDDAGNGGNPMWQCNWNLGAIGGDLTYRDNSVNSLIGCLWIPSIGGNVYMKGLGNTYGTGDEGYATIKAMYDGGKIGGSCHLYKYDGTPYMTQGSFTAPKDYNFSGGKISEAVLCNYLEKAVTMSNYCHTATNTIDGYYGGDEDTRMMHDLGVKFAGRALCTWDEPGMFKSPSTFISDAKTKIDAYHVTDPDVIFEGAVLEYGSVKINSVKINIPDWVYTAFGKTVGSGKFTFAANPYHGDMVDMNSEMGQMWLYYQAVRFMEAGCEAIHLGQAIEMSRKSDGSYNMDGLFDLAAKLRAAAVTKCRRGTVLLNAHVSSDAMSNIVRNGKCVFDFVEYPLRPKEGSTFPEASLEIGYRGAVYQKTPACTTPSGYAASKLQYLIEFDNFGASNHPGTKGNDDFVWGYDEISWLAVMCLDGKTATARNYLESYRNQIAAWDPNVGHLQMPGLRYVEGVINTKGGGLGKTPWADWNAFHAQAPSELCPHGYSLEGKIKELFGN